MEEQLSPLAVTHLLQHTLRSLCGHDDAQWVYAVFWRILPRNYPPPKWVAVRSFRYVRSICALVSRPFSSSSSSSSLTRSLRLVVWFVSAMAVVACWVVVVEWSWLNCLSARCSDGISRAAYTTGQEGTGGTGTTCYLTLMLTQVILFLFSFLWICVLFVRDSWVANQIKSSISVQDPGMGGWILQLRSLCLWPPRGRSCSCRRRRRGGLHGVCYRAGGRHGPAAWALLQDVPRHLQLRWRVRVYLVVRHNGY